MPDQISKIRSIDDNDSNLAQLKMLGHLLAECQEDINSDVIITAGNRIWELTEEVIQFCKSRYAEIQSLNEDKGGQS